MSDTQNLKRTLELSVPAAEVEQETERVLETLRKKVKLPGFRPGKVPTDILRKRFAQDIRQEVIEKLVPRHFFERAEREGLNVVGNPNISDVKLAQGEPLTFKAEFEVAPEIELKEYKEIEIAYQDPEVTDEDIEKRLEEIREQKADYISVDPRPAAEGDYAVLSLESVGGIAGQPIKQDEVTLHMGGEDTVAGFTENLLGVTPGEEKEFEVTYPEDYGQPRLAGKTVRFRAHLKAIRKKELPELTDEFARDLGDYQNMDEVRQAVRTAIFGERQFFAQHAAKNALVEKLVTLHEFPVPEVFIERQIELQVEQHLRSLAAEGIDPRSIKLDWEKLKETQREKAIGEIKGSLLVGKIADAEGIHATNDDVDREVQRIARQDREPVAAVRIRLEKEDGLRRIASRIRTEKTLNFLFEHARKVAAE
jgi:trigger factor